MAKPGHNPFVEATSGDDDGGDGGGGECEWSPDSPVAPEGCVLINDEAEVDDDGGAGSSGDEPGSGSQGGGGRSLAGFIAGDSSSGDSSSSGGSSSDDSDGSSSSDDEGLTLAQLKHKAQAQQGQPVAQPQPPPSIQPDFSWPRGGGWEKYAVNGGTAALQLPPRRGVRFAAGTMDYLRLEPSFSPTDHVGVALRIGSGNIDCCWHIGVIVAGAAPDFSSGKRLASSGDSIWCACCAV